MRSRIATRLAWSLCALALVLTAFSVVLLALNYSHTRTQVYGFWPENTVIPISFSIIGAIIASRLPANPLGWLLCAAASASAVAHFSGEYAIYALLAQPDTLPAGEVLAWLSAWVWIPFIAKR
jgi:ABC-type molybdate transport system permease subunit